MRRGGCEIQHLGHTGLLVSELSLGTMTFSASDGIWRSIAGVEQNLADQLLRLSLDAGINFVDTAHVYSNGESEKVLAQSIASLGITQRHCDCHQPKNGS